VWLLALGVLAAGEGPLFDWGQRPAVVVARYSGGAAAAPRVVAVHAAEDGADLVLRFTFDRPVIEGLRHPDGSAASGRLRAVLYIDTDADRETGVDADTRDPKRGADRGVEVGTRHLAPDPDEGRPRAEVIVSAALRALRKGGQRRLLWSADADADSEPRRISAYGDCVELRVPADRVGLGAGARFILSETEQAFEGRWPQLER
jgi:hypothetical protein